MRRNRIAALGLVVCFTPGCAYVPSLDQASGAGPNETPLLISDVVKRIKCEIADSFDDRLGDPRFQWLENWTAKVDLTLQINDTAGVSPSVSYTKYFKNDFNFAAGSTSLTSNVISAVPQMFTLSGSASYSEQAQRAETLTFTVSLHEIKNWKAARDKYLRGKYGADVAEHFCDSNERELKGQLGLREWIDSALYPVSKSQLQAGIHPQTANPSKPPTPAPPKAAGQEITPDVPQPIAKQKVDDSAQAANKSATNAAGYQTTVATNIATVQTAMQTNIAPYYAVLTNELKGILTNNISSLNTIQRFINQDVENAENANKAAQEIAKRVDSAASTAMISQSTIDEAKALANEGKKFEDDAKTQQAVAAKIANSIQTFTPNPPIDGLLHSIQFVVTYGAGITPNWSLLMWKGPGVTVPGASLSGVRTNILNIALGPTAEQNRLIQNQVVSSIGSHP
jgi:hypothetical protein